MIKFKNISKNTIFIADLDLNCPYNNQTLQISLDKIKRSRFFKHLVNCGKIEIIEKGDSDFQNSLVFCEKIENIELKQLNSVSIRGHFLDHTGYAKVNRNLLFGLNKKIEAYGISQKSKIELNHEELKDISKHLVENVNPNIIIDSVIPTFAKADIGKYKILLTTIETKTIPQQFLDNANRYDELWVNSYFCKEVFQNHGYKKEITVIPNIVDFNIYKKTDKFDFKRDLKGYKFLSVFNWNWRKGYDILLRSYLQEFSSEDDVSLILLCKDFFGQDSNKIKNEIKQFINIYCKDKKNPQIIFLDGVFKQQDMPKIYSTVDSFVLFSRGEAFGNIFVEASACQCPVISTDVTGHTMFLNKQNSLLLEVDRFMKAEKTGVHFWDGQEMPSFQSEESNIQARRLLRYAFQNKEKHKEMNLKLKSFVEDNYNQKIVVDKILKKLKI